MDIADFIKLPASEAGWLYRHHREAGDAEEASRLHQAYFEAHRVKLSDDRQIAEAAAILNDASSAGSAGSVAAARKQRSIVRRVGAVLSLLSLGIGGFSIAAELGASGLALSTALVSMGFMLWLAGVIEDRLISICDAIAAK